LECSGKYRLTMVIHKHHIIPRHMGGNNDPSNIQTLTVEEHARAHKILWETYNKIEDYVAWQGLAGYAPKAELIRLLLSHKSKGRKPWNYGKSGYSVPASEQVIMNNRRRMQLDSERKKISDSLKGRTFTEEWKEKLSAAAKKQTNRAMTYKLTSPVGETLIIKNLSKFSKENNLLRVKLSAVASGKLPHHKGWICERVAA